MVGGAAIVACTHNTPRVIFFPFLYFLGHPLPFFSPSSSSSSHSYSSYALTHSHLLPQLHFFLHPGKRLVRKRLPNPHKRLTRPAIRAGHEEQLVVVRPVLSLHQCSYFVATRHGLLPASRTQSHLCCLRWWREREFIIVCVCVVGCEKLRGSSVCGEARQPQTDTDRHNTNTNQNNNNNLKPHTS